MHNLFDHLNWKLRRSHKLNAKKTSHSNNQMPFSTSFFCTVPRYLFIIIRRIHCYLPCPTNFLNCTFLTELKFSSDHSTAVMGNHTLRLRV